MFCLTEGFDGGDCCECTHNVGESYYCSYNISFNCLGPFAFCFDAYDLDYEYYRDYDLHNHDFDVDASVGAIDSGFSFAWWIMFICAFVAPVVFGGIKVCYLYSSMVRSNHTVSVNDYVIESTRNMQAFSWLEQYPQRTEGQETDIDSFGVDDTLPPAQ